VLVFSLYGKGCVAR